MENRELPYDESILEKCLPKYLENDIRNLKNGIKNKVKFLDCLVNEVEGSVNSAYVDGCISKKQWEYIQKKYVRGE